MKDRARTRFIISFLSPACILYGLFVIWPLLQSFAVSFYRWRGVSSHMKFAGFDNYNRLFADSIFWQAIRNNLSLLVFGGVAVLILGIALAHGTQGQGRLPRFLRSVYLLPSVMSLVVVAIVWQFIYNPSFGLLTSGMNAAGLGKVTRAWLGDESTALPAVGVVFVWYILGFYITLFAAGLRTIPSEVHEAAQLDGAHGLHKFWRVTWPMLWAVKRVAAVYLIVNVLNIFALVYLMTQGGPDRKTEVILTYLYESAFKNNQFGYATAIAVVNFILAMALCGFVLFLYRRNPEAARA